MKDKHSLRTRTRWQNNYRNLHEVNLTSNRFILTLTNIIQVTAEKTQSTQHTSVMHYYGLCVPTLCTGKS